MSSLRGELLAHRGCLVVGCSQQHCELVAFRARDIDWDGEPLTHMGLRYRLGDSVDLGGGLMTLQRLTGLSLPGGWASATEAFVVAPSVRSRRRLRTRRSLSRCVKLPITWHLAAVRG
jgi:hypothetical protein